MRSPLSSAHQGGFGITQATPLNGRPRVPRHNAGVWPRPGADVHLDMTADRYFVGGMGNIAAPAIFSRPSQAWAFDNGILRQFEANEVRRVRGPLGMTGWIRETSCTNMCTNTSNLSSAVAGVNGSGGSFPAGWIMEQPFGGLQPVIVGTGTEFGMEYLDVQCVGTTSIGNHLLISPSYQTGNVNVGLVQGQNACASYYYRLISGSVANVNVYADLSALQGTASNATFVSNTLTNALTPTAQVQRVYAAIAGAPALTGGMRMRIGIQPTVIGASYNFTLRLYLPQLEFYAVPTTPVKTFGSPAGRSTELLAVPFTLPLEGSVYMAFENLLLAAGTRQEAFVILDAGVDRLAVRGLGGVGDSTMSLVVGDGTVNNTFAPPPNTPALQNKIAFTYGPTGVQFARNGGYASVPTIWSGGGIPRPTLIGIAGGVTGGLELNGIVSEFITSRKPWTPEQLVALTR